MRARDKARGTWRHAPEMRLGRPETRQSTMWLSCGGAGPTSGTVPRSESIAMPHVPEACRDVWRKMRDGSCRCHKVGGWRLAVGSWWWLAAVGGWRLVADGGWRLVVPGGCP